MKQLHHITKNKENLVLRSQIIKLIRKFFWKKEFKEIETPNLVKHPTQQPNLSPIAVCVEDEKQAEFNGFLHTSPEYSMKKMIACGFGDIFSICKCYRNKEKFGGEHNTEFTMLEWYRTDVDFYQIMKDCEELFKFVANNLETQKIDTDFSQLISQDWKRTSMKDLWQQKLNINLDNYLNIESMKRLCSDLEVEFAQDDDYQDLFYRIFIQYIEEDLGKDKPLIVHHYPTQMADLSKKSEEHDGYAERFELYIDGVELANAFGELVDPEEQNQRLLKDKKQRENQKKQVYDIDKEFLQAVEKMPECSGIALGVDRMVQLYAGCEDIEDVLALPMRLLFN